MKKIGLINLILLLTCFFSCKEKKQAAIPATDKTEKNSFSSIEIKNPKNEEIALQLIYDSIDASSKIKKLHLALKQQFSHKKLNGCVLIQQAGIPLIKECSGNTCLKCNDAETLTPTSIFQLASVSKTFTAIATLKLVEQKKLSLKDSVQRFYPDFPYHKVTIEQLLSHRSGLPNYLYAFEDSSKTSTFPTNQKIMEWFERGKPDRYALPGKTFSYNNSNYAVLAALIEKVSGQSYAEYLKNSIFIPLGMKHTYVINAIADNASKTTGHERKRPIPKDFYDNVLGDKGIYSCTEDLLIWYQSLKENKILTPENMDLVFTPRSFERPGVRNYGLGFRMTLEKNSKEPKYIYHNGWWKGYSTLFWFDPNTDAFICILSNERNKAVYKTSKLIEILNGMPPPL